MKLYQIRTILSITLFMAANVLAQESLPQEQNAFYQDSGYLIQIGSGSWYNATSFHANSLRNSRIINNSIFLSNSIQTLPFNNVFLQIPLRDNSFHEPILDLSFGYNFSFGLRLSVRRLQAFSGSWNSISTNTQGRIWQNNQDTSEASRTQIRLEESFFPFRKEKNLYSGIGFTIGGMVEAERLVYTIHSFSSQPRFIDSEYLDILGHYLAGMEYQIQPNTNLLLKLKIQYQISANNRGIMKDKITSLGTNEDPFLSLFFPNLPLGTRNLSYEFNSKKEGFSFSFQTEFPIDDSSKIQIGFTTERIRYTIRKANSPSEISPILALFTGGGEEGSSSNISIVPLFLNNLGPFSSAVDITQIFSVEAKLKF